MANRAYYGLQNHMKSRIISRNTKTLIRPVLTYGAETWVLSKQDEHYLSIYFIQTNSCTLFKTHSHIKH